MYPVSSEIRFLAWPLVLLIVLLSLGLAILLRRRYVTSLVRLQRGASASAAPLPPLRSPPALRIEFDDARPEHDQMLPVEALHLRRRVLIVEFICAAGFWVVFLLFAAFGDGLLQGLAHAVRTGNTDSVVGQIGIIATLHPPLSDWREWPFLWLYLFGPPVVFICTQATLDKKYTIIAVVVAALALILQATTASGFLVEVALLTGVLGLFAVVVTLLQNPRLRGAAAPLVVAFTVTGVIWFSIGIAISALEGELQPGGNDEPFSLGDALSFGGLTLIMIVTSAAVLFRLAVQYERKQYSDVELGQVAFWSLAALAAFGTGSFMNFGTLASLAGQTAVLVGCWFLYRALRRTWLRRIVRWAPTGVGSLLVLRVFKSAARSEAFYSHLFSYWRFAAPVCMIAGADLAEANLEPDKFFAWLRRRLRNEFIRSADQIAPRVEALDQQRDPDGRFRVNELFCTEETWRHTFESLVGKAGPILLDIREYTPDRSGTRYEIHQLMSLAALDRLVVVAGERDDSAVIAEALGSAWAAMSDASPNRQLDAPTLRVFRLRSGSTREVRSVLARLTTVAWRAGLRPS